MTRLWGGVLGLIWDLNTSQKLGIQGVPWWSNVPWPFGFALDVWSRSQKVNLLFPDPVACLWERLMHISLGVNTRFHRVYPCVLGVNKYRKPCLTKLTLS